MKVHTSYMAMLKSAFVLAANRGPRHTLTGPIAMGKSLVINAARVNKVAKAPIGHRFFCVYE